MRVGFDRGSVGIDLAPQYCNLPKRKRQNCVNLYRKIAVRRCIVDWLLMLDPVESRRSLTQGIVLEFIAGWRKEMGITNMTPRLRPLAPALSIAPLLLG